MPQFDLEYLLLFGPPENKLELIHGKTLSSPISTVPMSADSTSTGTVTLFG
jgi:hypothetical protein